MGVLAWLMLVISSLAAAPPGTAVVPHAHAMAATVAMVGGERADQAAPVTAAASAGAEQVDCCGDLTAHHYCVCAAMCVTALTPMVALTLAPVAATAVYAMPRRITPPALVTAPPLRPPAA